MINLLIDNFKTLFIYTLSWTPWIIISIIPSMIIIKLLDKNYKGEYFGIMGVFLFKMLEREKI